VKIDINKVPYEGLTLEETVAAAKLDLDTEIINFCAPIKITANVSRIANAISVELFIDACLRTSCSRCLNEFDISLKKNLKLNYPADKLEPIIDLDTDIREEIILDYPLKPLCKPNCKGLCLKCGINLNEGRCNC
jgi:uncharacterized protein